MIIEALCVECIIIQVDVIEAEAEFSKLIRLLESKTEHFYHYSQKLRAVVIMKLYEEGTVTDRIGVARGKFDVPDNFDETNNDIATMMAERNI